MFQILIVAAIIILLLDLSAWRYGRDLLRLDSGFQRSTTYGAFVAKRLPIIIAVFAALVFVMTDSYKSIYLRVALLVVVLIGYIVITLKDLKDG